MSGSDLQFRTVIHEVGDPCARLVIITPAAADTPAQEETL